MSLNTIPISIFTEFTYSFAVRRRLIKRHFQRFFFLPLLRKCRVVIEKNIDKKACKYNKLPNMIQRMLKRKV